MGLKDATINIAANSIADAFENINKVGTTMSNILAKSNDGMGISVGNITSSVVDDMASTIQPALQGTACAISVLFFLIALLDLANSDRFSLEQFIKFFAKLAISAVLILNCQELTTKILEFGDAFTSVLGGAQGASDSFDKQTIVDKVTEGYKNEQDLSFITPLCDALLVAAPMAIISKVLVIVTYVVAMTRMIEIAIRSCFMPIAFALMSDDGWRGAGGRYIRKFIAICAQGGVLVIIGKVTTTIIAKVGLETANNFSPDNVGQALIIMIGVGVACVSVMFKSIGIVNDVFGA